MNKNFWKTIGPGLIWAGAAVGVSHLVQSTRAGAGYGFSLIWIVLLANLFKYPFFEFGPRYAAATKESLIHGYNRIGKWAVYLFLIVTFATMFTIQAAVTAVTAGIISSIFPGLLSFFEWTILLLVLCAIILLLGKYKMLDRLMKVIVIILSFSTLIAVVFAAGRGFHPNTEFTRTISWDFADVAFIVALAGWMPSAIDISVWHSLWTIARAKQTGHHPSVKEAVLDFKIGYIGTAILAVFFLSLGAFCMYGSGISFSQNGTEFAGQFFQLYTQSIGNWAYYIIAIAALATMFSTTLTVLDAYPRVLSPVSEILSPMITQKVSANTLSIFWSAIVVIGALLILSYFKSQMKLLVDVATTFSFITAPILGYLNLRAVTGTNIKKHDRPSSSLLVLSWLGLFILSAFAIYFIVLKIVG